MSISFVLGGESIGWLYITGFETAETFREELFLLFKMQAQSHEKRQILPRMRGKAAMVKLIDYIRYAPLAIKQIFWEIRYK